jgi:hypothetical protein
VAAPLRIAAQAVAYAAFFAVVGAFSAAPVYSPLAPGLALVRVSFSHAGERVQPCRRFTPEEIAALAPNMRRALDCARERVALRLQVSVDGETVMDRELPPSGLAGDGAATVYGRFPVPAGRHHVVAKLRDSRREQGFDHEAAFDLDLKAGDSRVLGFVPQEGGFKVL